MAHSVEVYADVGCPFAYVGLTRLFAERDRRQARIPITVRAWPLEYVNGQPLDPHHIIAEVDDIRAQVAPDLFAGARADTFPPSSLPAFALTSAAYADSQAAGEAVAMEVRRAVFERGLDASDPDVLASIAAAHGLTVPTDTAAVDVEYEGGRQRGVVGSPHIFVDEYSVFCPTLKIAKQDDGHFQVDLDPASIERLMARIFD
ncbi:MAG: DsbA family protein [Acidimicrobiales bacterium]